MSAPRVDLGELVLDDSAMAENRACRAVVEEFRAWLAQNAAPAAALQLCDEIRDRIHLRELRAEITRHKRTPLGPRP